MSRVVIGSAAYKITADTSGLTEGVKITRREINQANRILEQTKPAAEKLEESMALLEKAFNAGSISSEKYNKAIEALSQQKEMLSGEAKEVARLLEETKPAAQKLEESMSLLEKAFNAGSISAENYNQAMETLAERKKNLSAEGREVARILEATKPATDKLQESMSLLQKAFNAGTVNATDYNRAMAALAHQKNMLSAEGREVARILEATIPATQKLEEQMRLLEDAFKAGTISAQSYNQAMTSLHQQKNMLAANTSQVAQALKTLPLPDVAKQAIDAAANVKQLGEALKTLMASPQVIAMVAAVTALTVAYRLLTDQIKKAKEEQEKLLSQQEQVARAAARSAAAGTATELAMIKQINDERRQETELLKLREKVLGQTSELGAKALQIESDIKRIRLELIEEEKAGSFVDEEKIKKLKEQLRTAEEQLGTNEETRRLLRDQLAEIERITSEEGKAQRKREENLQWLNNFYNTINSLDEEIIRLKDVAAGKDAEREKMLREGNDTAKAWLKSRWEEIDALNAQIEAQRQAEKEREAAAKKQIDDIKAAISEHEKLTEEMQKQAEAIKDAQDPSRALGRRLGDLEQMGMQGMLSPEEVAAAIAEAVGQHLDAMERDKQSVQMIDRNTMAHIQFEQKMQTEDEKREKKSLQIQEKQAEILGNIERTNQATADALAALDLV